MIRPSGFAIKPRKGKIMNRLFLWAACSLALINTSFAGESFELVFDNIVVEKDHTDWASYEAVLSECGFEEYARSVDIDASKIIDEYREGATYTFPWDGQTLMTFALLPNLKSENGDIYYKNTKSHNIIMSEKRCGFHAEEGYVNEETSGKITIENCMKQFRANPSQNRCDMNFTNHEVGTIHFKLHINRKRS